MIPKTTALQVKEIREKSGIGLLESYKIADKNNLIKAVHKIDDSNIREILSKIIEML